MKKDKIFVRVFDWPRGPLEIDGLQERVLSAYLVPADNPVEDAEVGRRIAY